MWLKEIRDRKQRLPAIYVNEVNAALENIVSYPHMGGKKGSLMLAYHQIEYIGQRCYDLIKKHLKHMLLEEIKIRQLLKEKSNWDKPKAQNYGEIWCADFTEIKVLGMVVYIAIVLDAFSHYYLGYHVSESADFDLVDGAFIMALEKCQGALPERCMLNDRGSQYKYKLYRDHLKEYDIEQVFTPPRTPWNNGEAEVGMRDIKALFYKRLSHTQKQSHQSIVSYSSIIADEVFKELNERIPRLKLRGVTPLDIVMKKADQKRNAISSFVQECKEKREIKERIENLDMHIRKNIYISTWSNCRLRNLFDLVNQDYRNIIPEKV